MRKFFSGAVFLFLALLSSSAPLFADFKLRDNIKEFGEKRFVKTTPAHLKAGPLRIHPWIRNGVAYDSNILQESNDPKDDVVFNIRPGAILELPVNRHQFAAGYEADLEVFTKRDDQNDINQNFFALADLNFPNWYVNVLEELKETSSRSGTTFTSRVPRIDQSINPKVGYHFKRFTFEAGFRHFIRDFRRQVDDPLDFHLTEWNGVVFYDLFARLKSLLDYKLANIDYNDSPDRRGTFNQVRAGLQGEIYRNIFLDVRVGPQFRNYHTSSKPDFYSWVGNVELEYKIRENISWMANASREAVEATFADINYYKEHVFGTGIEYTLMKKYVLFTNFEYKRHDYAERSTLDLRTGYRRDHHAGVRTGIRYKINPYMEVETGYQYLRRDSNFALFDYTDHIVYFDSKLSY